MDVIGSNLKNDTIRISKPESHYDFPPQIDSTPQESQTKNKTRTKTQKLETTLTLTLTIILTTYLKI